MRRWLVAAAMVLSACSPSPPSGPFGASTVADSGPEASTTPTTALPTTSPTQPVSTTTTISTTQSTTSTLAEVMGEPALRWITVPPGWEVSEDGRTISDPTSGALIVIDPPPGLEPVTSVGDLLSGTGEGRRATGVVLEIAGEIGAVRRMVLAVERAEGDHTIHLEAPSDRYAEVLPTLTMAVGVDLVSMEQPDPAALEPVAIVEYLELVSSADPADASEAAALSTDFASWYAGFFGALSPGVPGAVEELGDGRWEVCDANGCAIFSEFVGRDGRVAAFSIDGAPIRTGLWRPSDLVGGGCRGSAVEICSGSSPDGVIEISAAFVSGGGRLIVVWEIDSTYSSVALAASSGSTEIQFVDPPPGVEQQSCGLDADTFEFEQTASEVRFGDGQRDTFWCVFGGFAPWPDFERLHLEMAAKIDGVSSSLAWFLPDLPSS